MSCRIVLMLIYLLRQVCGECVPDVRSISLYRQFPLRSIPYYIQVQAVPCLGKTRIYYRWTVIREDGKTFSEFKSSTNLLRIDGYSPSLLWQESFGHIFHARVDVSHDSDFDRSYYDVAYFRFEPESMILNIKGGLRKTHLAGTDLILDGLTDSRDFSFAPGENGLSGNYVEWTVEPELNLSLPNSYTVTVPGSELEVDKKYVFTMSVMREKIEDRTNKRQIVQEVKIVEHVPELEIICLKNCYYSNPLDVTMFKVNCDGDCNENEYTWKSKPALITPDNTEFGDGTNKLLIKPKSAKFDEVYLISAYLGNANAGYGIEYIADITDGMCYITPLSGIAGVTQFEINCQDVFSANGDVAFMPYLGDAENDEKAVMISYGYKDEIDKILLPPGGHKISVRARDLHYVEKVFQAGSVTVKEIEQSYKDVNVELWLRNEILGRHAMSLNGLVVQRNTIALIQRVSVWLSEIESAKLKPSVKMDLMKHMAEGLASKSSSHIMIAEQTLSVLWKFIEIKEDKDTEVTREIGKILLKVTERLHSLATDPYESFVTFTFVFDFSEKVLKVFSELLKLNDGIMSALVEVMPEHDYDSYDEMRSEKLSMRSNLASFFSNFVRSTDLIAEAILSKMITEQKPVEMTTSMFRIIIEKSSPSSLPRKISCDGIDRVVISENLILDLEVHDEVGYLLLVFTSNPFWWHANKESLSVEFIIFDLYSGREHITELSEDLEIYMKIGEDASKPISDTADGDSYVVYNVMIRKRSNLVVSVDQDGLLLFLKDCPPTKKEIKKSGIEKELIYQNGDKDQEYFLGILNTGGDTKNFELTVAEYNCLIWKNDEEAFSDELIGSSLRDKDLICLTRHLSFFSGSVGVPPNKITVPEELDFTLFLEKNITMIIILLCILLLWILLMIWAIFRDRRIKKRNTVIWLKDTMPGDEYGYLIVIVTGTHFDAGTTANVCIQLVGTESTSRVHLIQCNQYVPLQRGYEDWFLMYCPKKLGDVTALRMWHDCMGKMPHWYCSRVVVQELQTGNQYCFLVEQWFSLVWGDAQVSREIPVTDSNKLRKMKNVYPVTLERSFRDGHLWLSIFASDPQNNFSTKERVTVCICLLLVSMLANAMFYGIPKGDPSDAIFSRGSYYLTWDEVLIMLESALVTIPIGFILIILFRRSGPPPLYVPEDKDEKKKDEKKAGDEKKEDRKVTKDEEERNKEAMKKKKEDEEGKKDQPELNINEQNMRDDLLTTYDHAFPNI